MFASFRRFLTDWSEMKRFKALPAADRQIVFYAEGRHDWPHFAPIVEELVETHHRRIAFLTSEHDDPILKEHHEKVLPFDIGTGTVRTILFTSLEAGVLVMSLPDLHKYNLKRSKFPVHYVYVFHALNSTHMVYREAAFDHYDTVLCGGPHHVREIRKTEEVYGLPKKRLVEHGYGRLDAIIAEAAQGGELAPRPGPEKRLLLSPSWGECSFIEASYAEQFLQILLVAGHDLTLRLHPMTVRHHPELAPGLEKKFAPSGRFRVETDMRSQASLHASDLMISDWSGSAQEYLFGLERPVLFVNTPPKVVNPHWEKIGLPTIQHTIRSSLGDAVSPDDLASAPDRIAKLCADPHAFRDQLRQERERWVFNVGRSGKAGGQAVLEALALATPGSANVSTPSTDSTEAGVP